MQKSIKKRYVRNTTSPPVITDIFSRDSSAVEGLRPSNKSRWTPDRGVGEHTKFDDGNHRFPISLIGGDDKEETNSLALQFRVNESVFVNPMRVNTLLCACFKLR